jgi:hypothetical protein
MSSRLENCPGFSVSKRRTTAESNGNTCGFFVHRNASQLRTHVLFCILREYRWSLNLKGLSWAENFVNTSVSTKLPSKGKRLPAHSASAQSHRTSRIRFYNGVAAAKAPSGQAFVTIDNSAIESGVWFARADALGHFRVGEYYMRISL